VQLAGAAVVILIYHAVLPWTKLRPSSDPRLGVTWYTLGSAVIIALRTRQDLAVMEGIGCVHLSRFLSGTYMLLSGVTASVGVAVSARLEVMAVAVLIASVLYAVATRLVLRRVVSTDLARVGSAGSLTRALWRSAVSMGIVNTGQWLVSVAQVPLIGSLLGPDKVAPFYAAQKIGQTLNTAALQLVGPQLPLFTQALAQKQTVAATARLRKTFTLQIAIAISINLVFFGIGPTIAVAVLHSQQYVNTATRSVLAVDYTLMSVSVVAAHFVLAAGRNPFLWTTLVAGIMNIGIGVVLAPRYGVLGIALGGLCAGVATNYWFALWHGWKLLRRLVRCD
jgi:O-antigen/teichoic acid export membrane protein